MFSNSPSGSLPHPSSLQRHSGTVQLEMQSQHQNPAPTFPTSTNPFDNPFDEAFENNNGGDNDQIHGLTGQRSIYEEQLMQQQRVITKEEARLAELVMRREQVKEDAEASKQLEKDINDLQQIMQDLDQLVNQQHDMVDSIEDHVERTLHEVQAGERHLRRAVASQSAKLPVMAAAVGGVAAGGPVGIAAGSAIAGIAAAVGGAFAGLYGGKLLKKQAQKQAAGGRGGTSQQ